jgi:hypothetical protein
MLIVTSNYFITTEHVYTVNGTKADNSRRVNVYGGGVGRWDVLEALPVDDGRTGLVVFLLTDPHLLEGGERGQDGAADPHRVLTLGGSDDLEEVERRGEMWRVG